MLMLVLSLIAVIAVVNDHNGWTSRLVIEAALPVLLAASLTVAEISEAVEHQQMLSTSFRWLVVNASKTCR